MNENDVNNNCKPFSFINAIRGFKSPRKPDVKKLIQNVLIWNTQRKLKELEQNKQVRFVGALLNASMSSSPIIDKFISWFLAVTGAIFILAFSNQNGITVVIPKLSIVISGFLISAFFWISAETDPTKLHTRMLYRTILDPLTIAYESEG